MSFKHSINELLILGIISNCSKNKSIVSQDVVPKLELSISNSE